MGVLVVLVSIAAPHPLLVELDPSHSALELSYTAPAYQSKVVTRNNTGDREGSTDEVLELWWFSARELNQQKPCWGYRGRESTASKY